MPAISFLVGHGNTLPEHIIRKISKARSNAGNGPSGLVSRGFTAARFGCTVRRAVKMDRTSQTDRSRVFQRPHVGPTMIRRKRRDRPPTHGHLHNRHSTGSWTSLFDSARHRGDPPTLYRSTANHHDGRREFTDDGEQVEERGWGRKKGWAGERQRSLKDWYGCIFVFSH